MLLKLLSIFVCLLIGLGITVRHQKKLHMKFMAWAFAIDMGMVLYIELTRKAINTALHPTHDFVVFHILISVAVVFLYLAQIATGLRMKKTGRKITWHRYLAIAFVVFRFSNLITSFYLDEFKVHS